LELQTANRYQKKARKRLCFLMMIFAAVLAVILLVILATK
jgi:cytochrome c-type biogenesis protein CcmE